MTTKFARTRETASSRNPGNARGSSAAPIADRSAGSTLARIAACDAPPNAGTDAENHTSRNAGGGNWGCGLAGVAVFWPETETESSSAALAEFVLGNPTPADALEIPSDPIARFLASSHSSFSAPTRSMIVARVCADCIAATARRALSSASFASARNRDARSVAASSDARIDSSAADADARPSARASAVSAARRRSKARIFSSASRTSRRAEAAASVASSSCI